MGVGSVGLNAARNLDQWSGTGIEPQWLRSTIWLVLLAGYVSINQMVDESEGSAIEQKRGAMVRLLGWQLIGLILEFLLGMVVNVWVVVPRTHPGAQASNYFYGIWRGILWATTDANGFLKVHILLGILLWFMAIGLIPVAIRLQDRPVLVLTVIGWIAMTGAGFNGASFLNYGLSLSSFLMAIGFIIAAVCYGWSWGTCLRRLAMRNKAIVHG